MSQSRKKHPTTESTEMSRAVASRVLILDFGSQYTQLIARRVRELNVYSEVMPWSAADKQVRAFRPQAVILSGGPESAGSRDAPEVPGAVWSMGVPVLGICYGMQVLARRFGGHVSGAAKREFGHAGVKVTRSEPLFAGLDERQDVWMSHGDEVTDLPPGFQAMAYSDDGHIAAYGDIKRHYYGLQFHPEVRHTPDGVAILRCFITDIAGCRCDWTKSNVLAYEIDKVRKTLGDDDVLLALSGGVDSSVLAALLHRAVGAQLHCVFVDNGLLRLDEAAQVRETFGDHFGIDLTIIDASGRFLSALAGVTDPEEKRRRIGGMFIEVFEEVATGKYNRVQWLAQGTIYPDVIESAGSEAAHLIKSHHNVGGLPENMNLKLIEPLASLFKDEVRALGRDLGLPAAMIDRHPFPGPGLAVRVPGAVTVEALNLLRQADKIFIDELRTNNLYHSVAQAFCVLLPVRAVGVLGDGRHYGQVVVLRAVETDDFMTAQRAHLPDDFMNKVASRIVNEVRGISRVCYDITGKPPATIEWE